MFFDFTIKDIIDILLFALLLYYLYKLMKDSGSLNIFVGIMMFLFVWVLVSKILSMRLLGSVFDQMMNVGTIALVVIFREEIRNFFKSLGSRRYFKYMSTLFSRKDEKDVSEAYVMPVVKACMSMAQQKVGALIVIEQKVSLDDVIKTGEPINSDVSQRLIEAIFFKNAPLHDGAMVIRGGRIVAAQCLLPVSHDLNIPKRLGLRHRSAMGVSENSDAIAIIVSEETGNISIARNGKFSLNLDAHKLEQILSAQR
ncbi:MAG: diadenylate cyclase CdaA [Bacteroidaceae bacterium]|nr:diadenylate cyclase CdaA [Bacteroidaceae bacterium]